MPEGWGKNAYKYAGKMGLDNGPVPLRQFIFDRPGSPNESGRGRTQEDTQKHEKGLRGGKEKGGGAKGEGY